MSVKIIYFVHGTTIDNEKDIATGWLPGELSEIGIQQAKELANQVADKNFDVVFCSDLKRAVDSAQLGFGDKYKIIQDSRLRECNYGDFNGSKTRFKDGGMDQYVDTRYPNGESYRDVEKRINDFLEFIKINYDGKNIGIVAHQAPQLALEVLLKKKTWEGAIKDDWRNTKSWQPGWDYKLD